MTAVFAFAAIFGGLLVLLFAFGGDLDADTDLDVDGDIDIEGPTGSAFAVLAGIFSIRNVVFFAAFFGLGGLLFEAFGAGSPLAFLLAVVLGVAAAFMNHRLVRYIRRTDSDSTVTDDRIAGSIARVALPIANQRKGRVTAEIDGHRINLVALPYKPTDDVTFDVGDKVVIVTVENGSALVTAAEF